MSVSAEPRAPAGAREVGDAEDDVDRGGEAGGECGEQGEEGLATLRRRILAARDDPCQDGHGGDGGHGLLVEARRGEGKGKHHCERGEGAGPDDAAPARGPT
jgi:hypothetical protein